MNEVMNLGDSTLLGYVLYIVMAAYILALLWMRWQYYGICTEKKYVLALVVGYAIRCAAASRVRYLYLAGETEAHRESLHSWWWTAGQWIPLILTMIVVMHISYYFFDERRRKNGKKAV